MRRVDGTRFDVEVMATSYLDDMRPTVQVVFRDVSGRKRLETELRESEEFYRQLMSNLSLGVVIIDPATRMIESVNEAAVSMFGETEENIIGHHCYQVSLSRHGWCLSLTRRRQGGNKSGANIGKFGRQKTPHIKDRKTDQHSRTGKDAGMFHGHDRAGTSTIGVA